MPNQCVGNEFTVSCCRYIQGDPKTVTIITNARNTFFKEKGRRCAKSFLWNIRRETIGGCRL